MLTTWLSMAARLLNPLVVLPLVVVRLQPAEINIWNLLLIVVGFQLIFDLGFAPTFIRVFAYAMGGRSDLSRNTTYKFSIASHNSSPNWKLFAQIWGTMTRVYRRLGLFTFVGLSVVGAIVFQRPINLLNNPLDGWISLSLVVSGTATFVWGNGYAACLQGMNQIPVMRRWEIWMSFLNTVSLIIALSFNAGLVQIIAISQIWIVLNIMRNRWLVKRCAMVALRTHNGETKKTDNTVMLNVWPSVWRSGLGVMMSFGLVQGTAFLFAQTLSSNDSARYSLTVRLIQMVVAFSNVPFYTKLPKMASLMGNGRKNEILKIAQRGMGLSLLVYPSIFSLLLIGGDGLFHAIGANVEFPDPMLLSAFGFAYYIDRFGALNLQLYSLTNDILWHIANGVSGTMFIGLAVFLTAIYGTFGIPSAWGLSALLFYTPYSCFYVLKEFGMLPRSILTIALIGISVMAIATIFNCAN